METVKVSSKYQVVIPRAVRDNIKLRPGQEVQVVAYAGRIELIPVRMASELRGFLTNMKNDFERAADQL